PEQGVAEASADRLHASLDRLADEDAVDAALLPGRPPRLAHEVVVRGSDLARGADAEADQSEVALVRERRGRHLHHDRVTDQLRGVDSLRCARADNLATRSHAVRL